MFKDVILELDNERHPLTDTIRQMHELFNDYVDSTSHIIMQADSTAREIDRQSEKMCWVQDKYNWKRSQNKIMHENHRKSVSRIKKAKKKVQNVVKDCEDVRIKVCDQLKLMNHKRSRAVDNQVKTMLHDAFRSFDQMVHSKPLKSGPTKPEWRNIDDIHSQSLNWSHDLNGWKDDLDDTIISTEEQKKLLNVDYLPQQDDPPKQNQQSD